MQKEVNLELKREVVEQYRGGYPLILKENIQNWNSNLKEGDIVNLLTPKGSFVAKGYYGEQNKGHGWVLTLDKKEAINSNFFTQKIREAIDYREEVFNSNDTTAFRVFNGEGDGVGGLSIDYFDGYYLITWYSLGIYS